jgi:hypothetical protein
MHLNSAKNANYASISAQFPPFGSYRKGLLNRKRFGSSGFSLKQARKRLFRKQLARFFFRMFPHREDICFAWATAPSFAQTND